ncbi:GAF domain-containing protein [Nocardia wallacei]|uniref:GAF domain-containing protein n=1 Tax=Nocardia wallacei TaxID=480035 RepID=UPI002457703D|nr:GAF domain-containing protein [Nocardia wallacei]
MTCGSSTVAARCSKIVERFNQEGSATSEIDAMPKSGWTLIETLEPGRLTVVARDHEARDRTSFERAVTDQLGIGKAPGHEAAQWLEALIADMRSHPEAAATHRVLRNGHTVSARLVPVIGPDNALHGAHVWLGPDGAQPQQRPVSAFAFTWDSHLRLAEFPAALTGGTPRSQLTAPEIFRFVEPADGLSLIRALLSSQPGDSWSGAVTVTVGKNNRPGHVVMAAGTPPQPPAKWRGLLFETSTPMAGMSLEAAALAAIPRISQVHMVLVDIAKMRLIRWITDPLPDVQWKGQVDQRDTPHPDDVKRIFAAAADVFTGKAESAEVHDVRLRRRGGGWVVVDGSGAIVGTSDAGPALAVLQLRVTGHSDEPDPVAPTDAGHPGLDDPEQPDPLPS